MHNPNYAMIGKVFNLPLHNLGLRTTMKKTLQLSLIATALLSQLQATELTLAPIEITSTAIKTDELKSTDAVEVYTQQDIEKAHVQNVYEFLNQQTSVTTLPSYGNPFSQLIDIHGYGSSNGNNNVVITLNGRKLNNIDNAPQLLSSISPSSISKIEIIKSSGIVLGGNGANGGVINITTKQNNDKNIAFYLGSYGLTDGSFFVGHSDDTLSLSLSGEAQKSDGIRDIDDQENKDANKFSTATFNLAYTPIDEIELRLGAMYSNFNVIYASSLTQAQYKEDPKQKNSGSYPSVHQLFDTSSASAGISYFITDSLALNLDAKHEYKTSDYQPSYGLSSYIYNSAKFSVDYKSKLFSFSAGYDGFYGDRKQTGVLTTRDNNALFAMSQFNFGNNVIKAGYRYETVSYSHKDSSVDLSQDNSLNGIELGYNYAFSEEKSLFASYAHSYQAPNIDNFFSTTYPPPDYSPTVSFNQFIDPMKANNFTLGYNQISTINKFKISAYYVDLTDEIYYYKDLSNPYGGNSTNTNIDKSHKYGLDLYDKYIINQKFNVVLNYNYVQAIIDEEQQNSDDYAGKKLPGVSDHNAKATFSYLPNSYATLSLTQEYRSEAYAADDFNNNFSQKQDAYYPTNISATYAKDNWEIFAKINNLFDQSNGIWVQDDAIYPVNFTTTGFVGMKLKF